ncbi:MFS transporter [Chloroflexota bacterium]
MRLAWERTGGKVFYGWWIVLACAVINLYGGGAFYYGFSVFFKEIKEAFGWTALVVSLAPSLRSLESGIAAPIMGALTDRLGARKLIFAGVLVTGLGFILLSRINSLATFYGAFMVLTIGFSASSPAVMMTTVAHWFRRRVGLAMGIMMSGVGASGLVLLMVHWLIESYQWRTTLVVLGVMMLAIGLPLSLVVRHRPEPYGYLPDGEIKPPLPEDSPRPPDEGEGYGARQALGSRTFWLLSLVLAIQAMVLSAVALHIVYYLDEDVGLGAGTAVTVAAFMPLLSILGRLGFGWMGDSFDKRNVLAIAFILQVVGLLIFCYAQSLGYLALFLIAFAPAYGGAIVLRPAIQREYFGTRAFGAIQGWMMAALTVGGIAGPALAGWIYDSRGSYYLAWLAFAVAMAAVVPLLMMIKPPPILPPGRAAGG